MIIAAFIGLLTGYIAAAIEGFIEWVLYWPMKVVAFFISLAMPILVFYVDQAGIVPQNANQITPIWVTGFLVGLGLGIVLFMLQGSRLDTIFSTVSLSAPLVTFYAAPLAIPAHARGAQYTGELIDFVMRCLLEEGWCDSPQAFADPQYQNFQALMQGPEGELLVMVAASGFVIQLLILLILRAVQKRQRQSE